MDTLLTSFIESSIRSGFASASGLVVFTNGQRFSGRPTTLRGFMEDSGMIEQKAAAPPGVIEFPGSEMSDEDSALLSDGFLHLRVSAVLSGSIEHRYDPPVAMRFPVAAINAWHLGVPLPPLP